MAEEAAASAGKVVGKATVKAFMSPSINIVKVIPQGIIEIVLRGVAVVSHFNHLVPHCYGCKGHFSLYVVGLVP